MRFKHDGSYGFGAMLCRSTLLIWVGPWTFIHLWKRAENARRKETHRG